MAWLTGWAYRRSHVINPATGAGTDYQIKITVHYGSGTSSDKDVYCNNHCKTDFGDVRIVASDGVTILAGNANGFREKKVDSDYADIWVRIPDSLESSAVTIYVYYGNASATWSEDGSDTFPNFFEDFEGQTVGQPPTGWAGDTSYFLVSNVQAWHGTLSVAGKSSTTGAKVVSKSFTAQSGTFAVEIFLRNEATNKGDAFLLRDTSLVEATWVALRETGNIGYYDNAYHDFMAYVAQQFYRIRLNINTNTDTYNIYVNGVLKVSNAAFRNAVANIGNAGMGTYLNSVNRFFDLLFVHKWIDPEPAHGAWGSEETEIGNPAPYGFKTNLVMTL